MKRSNTKGLAPSRTAAGHRTAGMTNLLKHFLLMTLLLFANIGGAKADEVTIGDGGTANNQYLPGYNLYNYSYTQQIYTANEIGTAGTINSIAFKNTGEEKTRTYNIYMALTDKETFESVTDWVAMSEDDLVFSGELTFAVGEWTTITLDTPFAYDGSSNLIVSVADNSNAWSPSPHMACLVFTATSQAIRAYRDASAYDVAAPGATGTVLNVKNQIQLDITPSGVSICSKPSVAVSNITESGAVLTLSQGSGTYNVEYKKATETEWTTVATNSTETTFTLTGLEALTAYDVLVQSVCDDDATSDWRTTSFTTTAVATAVGDSWSDDFEGTECGWDLINGELTNAWTWGETVKNGGTHALYISNDGGTTNAYTNNDPTKVFAAKLLSFAEGKYEFSYDWMANGESTYDFLRVALVPGSQTLTAGTDYNSIAYNSLPSGWIALDGGSKLNLVTEWQTKIVAIDVAAGNYYLVFSWRNDNSTGNNPPAAIDNVSISRVTCLAVVEGLDVSDITTNGATLTWTAGEATQWQVAYSSGSSFENATEAMVSAASYEVTGLQPGTYYYAKVRAYCGGEDYGEWSEVLQFTTDCVTITEFPWTENFDSYTGTDDSSTNNLPVCWNYINKSTSSDYKGYPIVYSGSSNSSPNCLELCSNYISLFSPNHSLFSDPQPQYAILPPMENLAGKQITLWASGYNDASTFKVGTMTDPRDATTFVEIVEQMFTSNNFSTYQELEYMIPPNTTAHYIAIMIDAASSERTTNGVFIDDITIAEPPSCVKPYGLELVSATTTTATLSWTNGVGGQTAWQIVFSDDPAFDPDEVTPVDVNSNPATITGLAPGTIYYAYVRANCGDNDYSKWNNDCCMFTTKCEAITTFPWTENFDSYPGTTSGSTNNLPACWNYINECTYSGNKGYPIIYSDSEYSHSASNSLKLYSDYMNFRSHISPTSSIIPIIDTDPQPQYAILPEMENLAGKQITLWASGYNDASTFKVGLMTDPTDATTFVEMAEQTLTSSYQEFDYVIPADATAHYIAIMIDAATSGRIVNGVYIDDIVVAQAPSCPKPAGLAVTANSIAIHSATVTWTERGSATTWIVEYADNAEFENYLSATVEGEPTYTFQGLDAGTTYYVRVKAHCGEGEESEYSYVVSFTTCAAYVAPADLIVTVNTATSVTLSWTEKGEATQWQICLNNDEENLIEANATTWTLENLTEDATYTAKVRGYTNDGYTDWSTAVSFDTTAKLVIGSGNSTSGYLPTHTFYNNSLTQQIYTTAELGEAGVIESIDFFSTASERTRSLDIYMVSTDKDEFTSGTDWIPVTAADLVYSGEVTFLEDAWTTISLDDVFVYDGTNNVAIIVDDNTGSYISSSNFRVFTAADNKIQAIYSYSDYYDYTPTGTVDKEGTTTSVKNQIRIVKSALGDCMKPTNFKVTEVGPDFATLSWVEHGAAEEWVIDYNGSTVTATENPFTLTGLANETEYTVKVRPACDENLWSSVITFTTLIDNPVPTDLAATDVTSATATLSWKGFQESYNLRWRTAAITDIEEGFEDETEFAANWQMISNNTENDESSDVGFGRKNTAPKTGSYSFRFSSYSTADDYNQYLISPKLSGATSFEFYYKNYSTGYPETFRVGYSSTGTEIGNFTWGDEITISSGDWTLFQEAVPEGTKYVAINYYSNYEWYLFVDDILILCSNKDAGEWQTAENVTAPYSLTDLAADTKYEWQVRGVKGEEASEWSSHDFFTTLGFLELANDDSQKPDGEKNTDLINGDDGSPKDVMLAGRTLYKDDEWNTICLPFDVVLEDSPLSGAIAKTLTDATMTGTHVTLTFGNAVDKLEAGVPYILKWANNGDDDIVDPVFNGVTIVKSEAGTIEKADGNVKFIGYYDAFDIDADDTDIYYMTAGSKLKYTGVPRTLKSCRAYFQFTEAAAARQFVLDFGDGDVTTGIVTLDNLSVSQSDDYYDLLGRKMPNGQMRKGLYINNGKKVVIK